MFKVCNSLNMCLILVFCSLFTTVLGSSADSYKDQFCTDPRTMQKHAAYSEWPDSYSCTRHRCQPGGRNLAIYTVGCKRVEAPESAIECEEVVEDTNMQFPYCCTRLRCLVVVRGEVWTRVLGQPWETLPAAPWSHMYKMKRPPPSDSAFANKNAADRGPVYELLSDSENEKTILRASKKNSPTTNHETVARAVPSPDIVIALATPNDEKKKDNFRRIKAKSQSEPGDDVEDLDKDHVDIDLDDAPTGEKVSWTEIPSSQWTEHDPAMDVENSRVPKEKIDKASGLQALVDAIGSRMRDIENVVQRMTEQVQNKPEADLSSGERRSDIEAPHKHQKSDERTHEIEVLHGRNKASPAGDQYKRFSFKNRSENLRNGDVTSERPASDDANLNGYFSDASNSVGRRSRLSEEPAIPPTYVAPVENRHRSRDASEEAEKKHKKHLHKKKRKSKSHRRHHKDDKKKHQSSKNRLSSSELDKTVISLEDSSNL